MSLSLSDIAVPTFLGGLGTLRSILELAAKHAENESMDPSELIEGRLAADMFTFAQQIQAATDTARRVIDRLGGAEPSSRPDPEATFAGLTQRVDETVEQIRAANRDAIDQIEETELEIDLGAGPMKFTGRSYLMTFAVPNFLFHVTTAYDILRHKGVALGKVTYIAPFVRA